MPKKAKPGPVEVKDSPTKEYEKYVKEHRRKLVRTVKEATGDNMNRPPEKDYT